MNQQRGSKKALQQPVFFLMIILAFVGLIYQLISDPLGLMTTIIVILLVLAAFYGIFRYTVGERASKKAQRDDKLAQFKVLEQRPPNSNKSINKPRRKEYPFKVIEGNKDKKRGSIH